LGGFPGGRFRHRRGHDDPVNRSALINTSTQFSTSLSRDGSEANTTYNSSFTVQ
jgi:hypothetical protein